MVVYEYTTDLVLPSKPHFILSLTIESSVRVYTLFHLILVSTFKTFTDIASPYVSEFLQLQNSAKGLRSPNHLLFDFFWAMEAWSGFHTPWKQTVSTRTVWNLDDLNIALFLCFVELSIYLLL